MVMFQEQLLRDALAACRAAIVYDQAIKAWAETKGKQSADGDFKFEGRTLDDLYEAWFWAARAVVQKADAAEPVRDMPVPSLAEIRGDAPVVVDGGTRFKYDGGNPLAKLHPGEPFVFVFAQQIDAPQLVRAAGVSYGEAGMLEEAKAFGSIADLMDVWRRSHPHRKQETDGARQWFQVASGQDPFCVSYADEPWAFIRAQDANAAAAVRKIVSCLHLDLPAHCFYSAAVARIEQWQAANPGKVKRPD